MNEMDDRRFVSFVYARICFMKIFSIEIKINFCLKFFYIYRITNDKKKKTKNMEKEKNMKYGIVLYTFKLLYTEKQVFKNIYILTLK